MNSRTIAVYTTRTILQFAAQHGADPEAICTRVGLDPTVLQTPNQRIPESLHLAIWREAVTQTGDENLALHLSEIFDLGMFGIPGYVLLNCRTLGEAFEKIERYSHLFCQMVPTRFSITGGLVYFECGCECVAALQCYPVDGLRYSIECAFASLLTAATALTGKPLRLSAACFQYPAPNDTSEYDRIFQTQLQFSMPTNCLIFDANCLNWPILSSNAELLPLFEHHAEMMLDEMNRTKRYTQQVVQVIRQQLTGELLTIEAIAHDLAISVRQLQRELQLEGTSFQKLLDETRKELAFRHLKNPATPIHDIAFVLGFSGSSAFNRAFKRWTGTTPGSYRLTREVSLTSS